MIDKKKILTPLVALLSPLCFFAGTAPSLATTTTGSLSVTATVASSCSVGSSTMDFASYTPSSGTALNATGSINVTCTSGTGYDIALNGGQSTSINARAMKSGANSLSYQLYTDSGRTTIWGDGATGSKLASLSGTGSAQSHTIYGQIPVQATAVSGAYTDTVTITVTY